jgi:hypothetical protein
MSKVNLRETEILTYVEKNVYKYIPEYKGTVRAEAAGFMIIFENAQDDIKIDITVHIVRDKTYSLVIRIKKQNNEAAVFEDTLKLSNKPNEEILIYILSFLAKSGIIDHSLYNYFQSLSGEYKEHYSLECLYPTKMSFSWSLDDSLFFMNNKKVDLSFENDAGHTDFVNEDMLAQYKAKRSSINSTQTLDLLFTNETSKFVHVMHHTDLSISDSQNNYLYFIIEQKNKTDSTAKKKDGSENTNFSVYTTNKLSAAFFDVINQTSGTFPSGRVGLLPKDIFLTKRCV